MRLALTILSAALALLLGGCQSMSNHAAKISIQQNRHCSIDISGLGQEKADVISKDWRITNECEIDMLAVDKPKDSDAPTTHQEKDK